MFKINFNFLTKNNKIDTRFFADLNFNNVREADDLDLHYNMFLGFTFFKSELSEIKLDWEIPLLSLAYSIISNFICIVEDDQDPKFSYEFIGNDYFIDFERLGNLITISTSYSDEKLETNINSFRIEIRKFFVEVTDRIKFEFPEIMENEHFVDLLKILDEFDNLNSSITHK